MSRKDISHDDFAVVISGTGKGALEELVFPSVSNLNPQHIGFLGVPQGVGEDGEEQVKNYLRQTIEYAEKQAASLLAVKARPGQEAAFVDCGFTPIDDLDEKTRKYVKAIFGRPERREGTTVYARTL